MGDIPNYVHLSSWLYVVSCKRFENKKFAPLQQSNFATLFTDPTLVAVQHFAVFSLFLVVPLRSIFLVHLPKEYLAELTNEPVECHTYD